MADDESIVAKVSEHLGYIGYTVKKEQPPAGTNADVRIATHPQKLNILVRDFNNGVMVQTLLRGNDTAKAEVLEYLSFVNDLNRASAVVRWYADKDSDLLGEAWYPGPYDRTGFGVFFDSWHRDTESQLTRAADAAKRFLR